MKFGFPELLVPFKCVFNCGDCRVSMLCTNPPKKKLKHSGIIRNSMLGLKTLEQDRYFLQYMCSRPSSGVLTIGQHSFHLKYLCNHEVVPV